MPDINQLRQKASSLFSGFTSGQKTILALAIAGVLLGGFMFTRWASTPSYTALFSNMTAGDAAAVTEQLSAQGVQYQLGDGGSTVLVPRDRVYQLRLDLSAQGLPNEESPGYALLDEQGITTSEFRQRVDYQRAMEGELAKTLGAIDGVDGATVHLVMPEEDLFAADDTKPSASVLLKTRQGTTLTAGQVQAVVHLVASSIEGLQPDQVTVADAAGRVLSAPGEDGTNAAAQDQRAAQRVAFEDELAASISELLVPVVGVGGAVVQVNADLDFDSRSTTTERFADPGTAPALTESVTNETYTGTGTGAVGILGPEGVPAGDGQATDYNRAQTERAFAVGKVTESVEEAPGTVQRLSVAVLLDGNAEGVVDQAEVTRLVTAAAGLQQARGDTVEISEMAFDTTAAKAAEEELAAQKKAEQSSSMTSMARTGGVVLIVLVTLFLAYRSAKRAQVTRLPIALPAGSSTALGGGGAMSLPSAEPDIELVLDMPAVEALPAVNEQRIEIQNEIGSLIDRQPEEVASVLRGWLADRRS
jgi:flagellar M-ring protein FliF